MAVMLRLPLWLRLGLLRLGVLLLVALPACAQAFGGLGEGAARRPYYTDATARLPIGQLARLVRELPPAWLGLTVASVLFALLADQLLTAAALVLLDPARPQDPPERVRSALGREGLRYLGTFLRAVGLGLLALGVGFALLRLLGRRLDVHAWRADWTALDATLGLGAWMGALSLLWLSSVGAWVFWCRLVAVADGRRRMLRTGLLVLRVFVRHPLSSWARFVVLTTATQLLGGAVLLAWRQAEPVRGAALAGWLGLWLLLLLAQALVWVHLASAGRRLYASARLGDLRARPDALLLGGRLRKLAFWRRGARGRGAQDD